MQHFYINLFKTWVSKLLFNFTIILIIAIILMLFCYGSESGKVFFIINLILIILLLTYTCELLIWLFIYELSIITILSAFLTEGDLIVDFMHYLHYYAFQF